MIMLITLLCTLLPSLPPPPLNFMEPIILGESTTPSLQICMYFTPDDIFRASKKREFCFYFIEEVLSPVDICPHLASSSVNTYRPNAFVPSHEYLNIGVERSNYTTFVPKNSLLKWRKEVPQDRNMNTERCHANIKLNFGCQCLSGYGPKLSF